VRNVATTVVSESATLPRNRILRALPRQLRERMSRHCQHVELSPGEIIYADHEPVEHMYFIESCTAARF
jgi:hypothetical protein